jgi:ribosome recycling factor
METAPDERKKSEKGNKRKKEGNKQQLKTIRRKAPAQIYNMFVDF